MTDSKENFQNEESMTDEDLVEIHSKLNVEKHPPTKGFLTAPLIFVFVFGCLIFVCSIQLAPPQISFNYTHQRKLLN